MPVKVLAFKELKKALDERKVEPLDILMKKKGVAYVVAITREKCPGCEKQKPLFEKLSNQIKEKHGDHVEFLRVHAWFSQEQKEEAKQCADAFHTVGFPTYIIGIKDSDGNSLETYRALESPMREIERNIKLGVEVAKWFKSKKK